MDNTKSVQKSLARLNRSIKKMDDVAKTVLEKKEKAGTKPPDIPVISQNDLFAGSGLSGTGVDKDALAKRIDNAIDKVEYLLKEGGA